MSDTALVSVTLPAWIWEGVLYHLADTVEYIPISLIDPDPYECVSEAITALKSKLNINEEDLNDF
jgi:hypothetical protein